MTAEPIVTGPVAEFLSQNPIPHVVGGRPYHGSGDGAIDVMNPSDGTRLATVHAGTAADVEAAVAAAERAQDGWAGLSPVARSAYMHRFAEAIERHAAELAQIEALDVGKAVTGAAGFDVPFGVECVRYYAEFAKQAVYDTPLAIKNMEARVHRAPRGVCGFVFPWNFPFTLAMWGTVPALAAGNTVVIKPSEVTPLSTLYTAQIAAEVLPPGVFNVVVGDGHGVGAALSGHPRVKHMSFTGSPAAGRLVAEACGRNLVPVKLELGGKGAAIVFDDVADVDDAAAKLAGAITFNTGQVCCTATRWLVHDRVYDRFVAAAGRSLGNTKVGPGTDPATQMGPLASRQHKSRVLGYLDRGRSTGAKTLFDGGPASVPGHEGGYYVTPTLLGGPDDNVCCREEVFGPTAYVLRFTDEYAAIKQVNSLTYGLANSVWTADLRRAARVAEHMVAGNSWINAHNVFAYGLPYGGVHLSGMGGGVNSPETFYDYLRPKTIARPLA